MIAILSAHGFKICAARLALFYLVAPSLVLPHLVLPRSLFCSAPTLFFQGRRATGIKTALLRIKILFFLKTEPNKDKFYKIYGFNFISQKLSAATQGASNFKIEILYVKLKAYKTPIFRAIQT